MAKKTQRQRNKARQERRALEKRQRELRENRRDTIAKIRKRLAQILSGGALIFGIYVGGLFLVPKIAISPFASVSPDDTFATPFLIKNEGYLSLQAIQYYCALYDFKFKDSAIKRWARKNVLFSTKPKLATPKLKPNESTTILCDFRAFSHAGGSVGPMNDGDMAIVASFRPSFLFWRREYRQRFTTMKSANGILYWHPQAD
jgi:hypothetical protein